MHGLFEKNFCFYTIGRDSTQLWTNLALDKFSGRENTHVRARMSICNLINKMNFTDICRDQHGSVKN